MYFQLTKHSAFDTINAVCTKTTTLPASVEEKGLKKSYSVIGVLIST